MSQAAATKLISKLRFKVHDRRRLRNPDGPKGRHDKIKKIVTALFKHERIEMNYHAADESRGYAERLIQEAIKHGDCHKPTMEMASYWIIEKPIVHKLFKVLAPRYQDYTISYTKLWRAPKNYPEQTPKCVLELRENIYPSLSTDKSYNKNLIHNVLLEEAKKVYRKEKALKAQAEIIKEQKKSAENKDSPSDVKESTADTIDVSSISLSDEKSEAASENIVKADNVKEGEGKGESGISSGAVNSSVKADLNPDEIKTSEEKQVESPVENDKK